MAVYDYKVRIILQRIRGQVRDRRGVGWCHRTEVMGDVQQVLQMLLEDCCQREEEIAGERQCEQEVESERERQKRSLRVDCKRRISI